MSAAASFGRIGLGSGMVEVKRLDPNVKQETSYCVPIWIRDLQIQRNNARVKGRIEAHQEKRTDPIALVCYGPSLNDTWEEIRKFKYVMTCSGSHKFMIDRGIIPRWQVEVDPRAHKVTLMGPPHPGG